METEKCPDYDKNPAEWKDWMIKQAKEFFLSEEGKKILIRARKQ